MESLIEIVKGTVAVFTHVCNGKAYFRIQTDNHLYQLEIDSLDEDWKNNYILPSYKSIELMRWIRKGLENQKTFILLK